MLHLATSLQVDAPPPRATDDEELLAKLRAASPDAERRFVEELSPRIERTLYRILGHYSDLEDLVQEVFIRVFDRLDRVNDGASLRAFTTATTVNVAREALRKRARWRWLVLTAPADTPEVEVRAATPEVRAAVVAFYDVVGRLSADERIAFTLRYVEELEVLEVAAACGLSLSTTKRRLRAAEARFAKLASNHPELRELLEEGTCRPRAR
ncbi:MAG: RNA polymerase sigma factor [Polyangiaceae bacterium]